MHQMSCERRARALEGTVFQEEQPQAKAGPALDEDGGRAAMTVTAVGPGWDFWTKCLPCRKCWKLLVGMTLVLCE